MPRPIRTRTSLHRLSAGFTVVELAVGITIFVVATLGLFSSHVASKKLIRTSQETDTAMTALQTTMERMFTVNIVDLTDEAGAYAAGQAVADMGDFGLDDVSIVPTYPDYEAGDDVLEIQLTMTWTTFDRGQRTLQLTSRKSD